MTFDIPMSDGVVRTRVVGVGGAGCQLIANLNPIGETIDRVAIDTDAKMLASAAVSGAAVCRIGQTLTRGFGTGGDVALARRAAETAKSELMHWCQGVDVLHVVAGAAGGVGGGVAPYLSKIATECGCVVITWFFTPFTFEGETKQKKSEIALTEVRAHNEATLAVPNDLLLQSEDASAWDAVRRAHKMVEQGIVLLQTVLTRPGIVPFDLSHLRRLLIHQSGKTLCSLGSGVGENYVQNAIADTLENPLLKTSFSPEQADVLMILCLGGNDLHLRNVQNVVQHLTAHLGGQRDVMVGVSIDANQTQMLEIGVIGTAYLSERKNIFKCDTAESYSDDNLKNYRLAPQDDNLFKPDERGCFNNYERTFLAGEDVDVPTYLRKGTKLGF